MDSAALAKLAGIGAGLTGPDGETLQDVQAERTAEEAAREALRKRVREAFKKIASAEGSIIELTCRGRGSDRAIEAQLDGVPARQRALLAQFEASPNPEEFVLKLENEAKEAEQAVEAERRKIRNGR